MGGYVVSRQTGENAVEHTEAAPAHGTTRRARGTEDVCDLKRGAKRRQLPGACSPIMSVPSLSVLRLMTSIETMCRPSGTFQLKIGNVVAIFRVLLGCHWQTSVRECLLPPSAQVDLTPQQGFSPLSGKPNQLKWPEQRSGSLLIGSRRRPRCLRKAWAADLFAKGWIKRRESTIVSATGQRAP